MKSKPIAYIKARTFTALPSEDRDPWVYKATCNRCWWRKYAYAGDYPYLIQKTDEHAQMHHPVWRGEQ